MAIQTPPIKIFIAYSRLDEKYLKELRKHLKPFHRNRTIQIWYDGEILPGSEWEQKIKAQLHAADIILLLVSANSFDSEYFYNQEMRAALERHKEKTAVVIPIILNYCYWEITELGSLQALPKNGKPIEDWKKADKAYDNIVRGVYKTIVALKAKQKRGKPSIEEEKKEEPIQPKEKPTPKIIKKPQYPFQIQKILQDMVKVEGGTFMMGANRKREQPIHKVTVPTFQIGKYPVTQAQWQAVMGNNPSHFKSCEDCPVEMVSWNDAKEFIEKLNKLTGKKFRLLSEAEWEFAARGGMKSKGFKYSGSNDVEEVAWYRANSNRKTHPVGKKKANELGLYDMSGNVWEWCEDDWHSSYKDAPDDGKAWIDEPRTNRRLLRGGSWDNFNGSFCRVAFRSYYNAFDRYYFIGLRLALPQF